MGTQDDMALVERLRQENMKLESRLNELNNGVVYPTGSYGSPYGAPIADQHEENEVKQLLRRVKDAGVAGAVSYAGWELLFWVASVPVCLFAYYGVTGHLPDLSNQEDIAQLGAEAFAFVNVARFAVPLRIGLALGTVPWVQANIIDRLSSMNNRQQY